MDFYYSSLNNNLVAMADKLTSDGTALVKSGTNLLPLPRITLEDTDVSLIFSY